MKEIILSACGAVALIDVMRIKLLKVKPFTCSKCMAGWFCLGLSIPAQVWYEIPFRMAAAMVTAIFISYGLRKTLP